MGFLYVASHQGDEITLDRIKSKYCLIGLKDGKIIATITYYSKCGPEYCAWYDKEGVGHFGQFGVDPDFQQYGIGSRLIESIEEYAKSLGDEEISLDTAEGADHLIKAYEKRGYRFIEYVNWKDTNYRSVVMSKKL
jgi:GNAT superfamily N-acetyltransferase